MNELATGIITGISIAVFVMIILAAYLNDFLTKDQERIAELKRREKSNKSNREIKIDDGLRNEIQQQLTN